MISNGVILGFIFSILVCFGVPVGGLIVLQVRKNKIGISFLLGCATFFVAQIVLRIPIIQLILFHQTWYIRLSHHPIAISLFAGFTAGLFEEVGRFITMRLFLKKRRQIDGIAFGLGHGGIEAMLLVGVNLLFSLFCLLVLRFNSANTLTHMLGEPAAAQIINSVDGLSSFAPFLSGIERISAIGLHIGLSLIVLYGLNKKQPIRYLLTALLLHTILDASVGITPLLGIGPIGLEIFIFIFSALVLFSELWLWKKEVKG